MRTIHSQTGPLGHLGVRYDFITVVLFPFVWLQQNAWDWVIYKQQTFISHSSEGLEVQDEGIKRFGVCLGARLHFQDDALWL